MYVRTNGGGNMHETRVIADGLRGEAQQIDDVLERCLAAEVDCSALRRNLLAGAGIAG